jgi:hypothetical protein
VVKNVNTGLESALERAFKTRKDYMDIQKKAFNYTFYNEAGSTAAERGARAIASFLRLSPAGKNQS